VPLRYHKINIILKNLTKSGPISLLLLINIIISGPDGAQSSLLHYDGTPR